jgi:transcriptional regulator with XRE-family HTH domain
MNKLGKLIKNTRIKKGLTQKQLADHVGVSPVHISDIEAGNRNMFTDMRAVKIALKLDLDPNEVVKLAILKKGKITLNVTDKNIDRAYELKKEWV